MRKLLVKGVAVLWALILIGLFLPNGNGPPAFHSFLRPDLWWLVASGALISVLFFLVSFAGDRHAHSHVKSRMGARIKPLLLLVPAPFILAFGKAEYGADALAGRLTMKRTQQAGYSSSMKASGPSQPAETASGPIEAAVPPVATNDSVNSTQAESPEADTPRDADEASAYRANLMTLLYAPESFAGMRVTTTGMMYQGNEFPENYLYCFRYVMVCCAADAIPVGVFIDKPQNFVFKKDAWYEIEGVVQPDSVDGYSVVKLNDAVMRPVPKPRVTWLYPQ
jgi:uncharacterized repeat protein (TIGR03943 family)